MSRYIDAEKLKAHYAWWEIGSDEHKEFKKTFDTIVDLQPTVDVAEDIVNELTKEISDRVIQALEANYDIIPKKPVVRCKDCKHFVRSEGVCKMLSNNCEPPVPVYVGDDDFCSRGEMRKEDCDETNSTD